MGEKILGFGGGGEGVGRMRGKCYVCMGSVCMGIGG